MIKKLIATAALTTILALPATASPDESAAVRKIEDYVEEVLEPFPYLPVPLPAEWEP